MNIEHRTLNIQHRKMYSVYFKKIESNESLLDVRCWMFDVQRSIFSRYRCHEVSQELNNAG
ncbi:hypothetical protein D1AOALGA4SA_9539 [Olavius algarvensis Delta 1 endosymbiont]|nr:hypothetical protein D1AOALGA4SA_9539 [Olavius algarvensis Delta 1 endosymbiont]